MALIGLRNFAYARMIKDNKYGNDVGVEYETPRKIVGINQIDINPTVNNATLFGDDSPLATASSLGEIEVSITIADIPLEDLSRLLGSQIDSTKNIMESAGDDKAPYVAIMFESDKHDGKTRYTKLLKGRFAVSQETINTKGDSVEFQLPQITGRFVVREYDKKWERKHDPKGTDTTVADTWYNYVDSSETTNTDTTVTFLGQ